MQLNFDCEVGFELETPEHRKSIELLSLSDYNHIIKSESGGKDSMACLFYLLELGVPKVKIELWVSGADGRGEDNIKFVDWPKRYNLNQSY
ncbi:hypothetical protein MKZ20_21530 [Psychrobacillus sp. FSL K6-2684]|uniref:hypothetical protein n=1 Tax=unclassified Psychrobacillus TaxID=2636677 RepID=UPI0030FCF688